MKTLLTIIAATVLAVTAYGVGTWYEYKPVTLEQVSFITDVAFNEAGTGFAASSTLSGGRRGYVWKYTRGEWRTITAPYDVITHLTVGRDGSCYGRDGHRRIWRLNPGAQYWQIIGDAGKVGLLGYEAAVGVGPREFWAGGVKANGHGLIVYYENDQPRQTFDLGLVDPYHGTIQLLLAIPGQVSPSGEASAVTTFYPGIQPEGEYRLYVLKTSGEISYYKVPISTQYACGGLVVRAPGDVLISFNNGDSFIFAFSNGKFTEVAYYADRCDVKAYPAPNDGWGVSYRDKVYHWTSSGPSEEYILSGRVLGLDFINAGSGWAVGSKEIEGVRVAMMWRYTDDVAIKATSLGRVKALFR
jgi:hypothetical protein